MKKSHLSMILATFTAVGGFSISTIALGDKAAGTGSGADNHFQMMDTNGDGKLAPEEHTGGARKMFQTMDANKDGKVTATEMDLAHDQMAGKRGAKSHMSAADKIKKLDSDGDGILTAEEHDAGAKTMFERMDTDRDGMVSKAELAAGHTKMMNKQAK
jgi:Ca2+-binding EF-hand superfamily protein